MLDIFAKKYYITASYMKHFEISRLVFFTVSFLGEYFKERGEQYGAVWDNVAPFPFGSLIAKLA